MQNMQTYELHRRKRELQEALERAIPRREGGHGLLAGDGIEFWQAMPRSRTDLSLSLSNVSGGRLHCGRKKKASDKNGRWVDFQYG